MKSRIEQYIRDHRDEFDSEEPDPKVWDQISHSLIPGHDKKVSGPKSLKLLYLRWTAAAAILVLAVWGIWQFTGQHQPLPGPIASDKTKNNVQPPKNDLPQAIDSNNQAFSGLPRDSSVAANRPNFDQSAGIDQDAINEEMYHYAKIVELRQRELKKLEKDEPLLYRQFSGDVNKLDSVYRSLKKQLATNPNREQLIEAMIENLQLQIALLNHQLDIIKQINYSKKSAYEKAYKPA